MNTNRTHRPMRRLALPFAAALALFAPVASHAYPPAPTHTIFGLVRNEYGEPLYVDGAQIIFEATNGTQVTGTIVPGLDAGINYRLAVAMDSGVAPDNYKATAFMPTLPFRIKVKIGTTTYLPLEMTGSYASLGKPASSTRIDLTLGVDSDNDGLPDAWEQLIIFMQGGSLGSITPNGDSDGDGISNLNEYLAGTYAFDSADGFALNLQRQSGANPLVEFTVRNLRTYTLQYSTDLKNWTTMNFKVPAEGASPPTRSHYIASDIRPLQVNPELPGGTNVLYHYRVLVQ